MKINSNNNNKKRVTSGWKATGHRYERTNGTYRKKKKKRCSFPCVLLRRREEKRGKRSSWAFQQIRIFKKKKNTLLSNANPINKHSSVVSQVLCFLLSLSGLAFMTTRLSMHYELWVKKKKTRQIIEIKKKKGQKGVQAAWRRDASGTPCSLRHTNTHTHTHV